MCTTIYYAQFLNGGFGKFLQNVLYVYLFYKYFKYVL